jgi:hypothetical protein
MRKTKAENACAALLGQRWQFREGVHVLVLNRLRIPAGLPVDHKKRI